MQPYPLSSGMLFREDFTSPYTLSLNGGVLTGTGLANGRFRPTTTGRITYTPIAPALFRLKKLTIATVVNCSASIAAYRTLLYVGNGTSPNFEVGFDTGTNKPFFLGSAATLVPASTFTVGKRSLIWAIDGANVVFYSDGASLGSVAGACGSVAETAYNMFVGNSIGFAKPFTEYVRTLQVYSNVFTAADALSWHQSSLRSF
jgi:hypothetical protein